MIHGAQHWPQIPQMVRMVLIFTTIISWGQHYQLCQSSTAVSFNRSRFRWQICGFQYWSFVQVNVRSLPMRRIKSINVLHNLFFAACEIQFRTGGQQRSCWADKYPISGLDAILTYYYSFVLVHCQDIIESSFWLDDRSFLTNFIDVGLTASLFLCTH